MLLQLKVREKQKWCAAYANAHHCGMMYKYDGATYFLRAHLEWNQFPYQQEELSAFWQNS